MRSLSADSGWERLVPLRWKHGAEVAHTDAAEVVFDALVYPTAVSVVARVEVDGNWRVDELADALADLREDNGWSLTRDGSTTDGLGLNAIAATLRREASKFLSTGAAPEPTAYSTVRSVAAPLLATGDKAKLAITDPDVQSCLSGLAVLGPPGTYVPGQLLDANTNTSTLGAHVYQLKDGHAIWHPRNMLVPLADRDLKPDPIRCLTRNHTDVVTQVAALSVIVEWAAAAIAANRQIRPDLQELVRRAAFRLLQLHEGPATTYRAGIAKVRAEPQLANIAAIRTALGWLG
jgi:hypothetical protein